MSNSCGSRRMNAVFDSVSPLLGGEPVAGQGATDGGLQETMPFIFPAVR